MSRPLQPDLAALLGSRICHDLINPLGAIGNGLELLELTGAEGPELTLIAQSVQNATARIRLFRIAFGAADPAQQMTGTELTTVLEGSFPRGRLVLSHDLDPWVARDDAKLALLATLCLETALPMGGNLHIAARRGRWHLRADGPRLRLQPELWEALSEPLRPDLFSAANIQFALLPDAATRASRVLAVDLSDGAITIRF